MALSQSALLEVLDALKVSDSTDVIRQALQVMLQQLNDAEAAAFIGAEPHERTTQRNGTRSKTITTTAGDVDPLDHQAPSGIVLPIAVGASPPHPPGPVRGDHGGRREQHERAQGRQPGQSVGRRHRDQPSPRSRGSAPISTRRLPGSPIGRWASRTSPTSSSTRPTAKPESVAPVTAKAPAWCPRRS